MVMQIRPGPPAGSTIVPVRAKSSDRNGQNEAEYQRLKDAIAADPRVEQFRAYVMAIWPDATVYIAANPCTRGWRPGTPGDVSMGILLPNVLSYCGGGPNLATALKRGRYTVDDFTASYVSASIARAFGGDWADYQHNRRPYHADYWVTDADDITGDTN